jgi:DMSO/TMAO reductase YedYZ molybdopterin-dependent catalytic subunit
MTLTITRRRLVQGALGAAIAGCGPTPGGAPDAAGPDAGPACPDPFAGGERVGLAAFVSERRQPFGEPFGAGLDGRLYTDLAALAADAMVVPNERFYVRTRTPGRLDLTDPERVRRGWRISVGGLARAPRDVTLAELLPRVGPRGTTLLECSGNGATADFGLMSAARWAGVALADVLALVQPLPEATRVLVAGFDDHTAPSATSRAGASWVFALADVARYGAFLATEMNGAPLPADHGFPVRLVVPRWYGCCCVKWVDRVALVGDDEPATDHMREFAARTHQDGVPELARDFRPATMDQAAMPVRVERWRVGARTLYKVVGVMWGGERAVDALEISFDDGETYAPVAVCPAPSPNDTWTLWSHPWSPAAPGLYHLRLRVADRSVPQRRLDAGYYARVVEVTAA